MSVKDKRCFAHNSSRVISIDLVSGICGIVFGLKYDKSRHNPGYYQGRRGDLLILIVSYNNRANK